MYALAIRYNPYLSRAAGILAGIIALALFMYGVFLLEAVAHTAARTQAQNEIRATKSHLAGLEGQYLDLTKNMDALKAQALGFVAPKEVTTVYASAPKVPLGYLGSRRTIESQ
jgi:hypothetical protein